MNAARDQLLPLMPSRGNCDSHPGLLLQRYVAHPADGSERWSQAKREIHAAAHSAVPCELYKTAFARWETSLAESKSAADVLQTAGRLIVGLGSENVLETGIRLHHTYGLPIIPGSAPREWPPTIVIRSGGRRIRNSKSQPGPKTRHTGSFWREMGHDWKTISTGCSSATPTIAAASCSTMPGSCPVPMTGR